MGVPASVGSEAAVRRRCQISAGATDRTRCKRTPHRFSRCTRAGSAKRRPAHLCILGRECLGASGDRELAAHFVGSIHLQEEAIQAARVGECLTHRGHIAARDLSAERTTEDGKDSVAGAGEGRRLTTKRSKPAAVSNSRCERRRLRYSGGAKASVGCGRPPVC